MTILVQFKDSAGFWKGMVVQDYQDYLSEQGDLRKALHLANSLFHMSDWVFFTHTSYIQATFSATIQNEKDFADYIEQSSDDFGRIRGIANAAKHLKLKSRRPVDNAPIHAENTAVHVTTYGEGVYGAGAYGGHPRVVLGGKRDMEFLHIATRTYRMWEALQATHGW